MKNLIPIINRNPIQAARNRNRDPRKHRIGQVCRKEAIQQMREAIHDLEHFRLMQLLRINAPGILLFSPSRSLRLVLFGLGKSWEQITRCIVSAGEGFGSKAGAFQNHFH